MSFSHRRENDMFLLAKEKNTYFSPQGEKIPKELLRLPPQTPIHLLGSIYPRLEGVAVLAKLAQATTRRAKSSCGWKLRARRRKLPDCTRRPFGVFRRGLHEFTECKHVPGADEMRFRLAQTVKRYACGFFSFFSCAYKKRTRFSFAKEKICAFLTEEKSTKRLTETLSRTLIVLLGSAYPRLPTVVCSRFARQANIRRAGSSCGWEVRANRRKARAV